MFGLIKRIKAARQADIRRRELMAEQDARIAKGFAELHTAVELVAQAESGRGPRGDVLRIGDGFYVERAEDGSERTVYLEKHPVQEHAARLDDFKASTGYRLTLPPLPEPPPIPDLHFTELQTPKL